MTRHHRLAMIAMAILLLSSPVFAASSDDIASVVRGPQGLLFHNLVPNDGGTLVVTGPEGFVSRLQLASATDISFDLAPGMADGSYTWELTLTPRLTAAQRLSMSQTRSTGDLAAARRLSAEVGLQAFSGYFTVKNGALVPEELAEKTAPTAPIGTGLESTQDSATFNNVSAADQLILDDLIVDGSACIGFDCVNGESFGFDTLRLKENNLRIKFQDTSNSASFPSRDWQLTANDSSNGGANKFSIDDIDGGRTPFTVEAGSPSNSLYVEDGGRVGFGTSTPVVDLHDKDGNTPTLRLEQDGSSGFTPQTWDVAGNEANFFIRDATNGSTLPFRIEPGAPSNALYINSAGNIGLGTTSPGNELVISDNNRPAIQLIDTTETEKWEIKRSGSGLAFVNDTNGTNLVLFDTGIVRMGSSSTPGSEVFLLQANGDLAITGDLTANGIVTASDVNLKEGFSTVDGQEVLTKLVNLPVTTWAFKSAPGVRHIGPMAQDFRAAFGFGDTETHINLTDIGGISIAAIQELHRQMEEKQAKMEALETQNAELLQRLEALEARLAP